MSELTPEQERELSEAAKLTCAWEITAATDAIGEENIGGESRSLKR